jgi:hypothetical protein
MSNFFQLFVAWGVLLLVVLSLYLIDKVNVIYRKNAGPEIPKTYDDGLFADLTGKTLWDAMSGIPVPGYPPDLLEKLRPHYEPVIRQHIEQLFMQGRQDGAKGTQHVPSNVGKFPTPRGSLESWLPMHHVASLYQVGFDDAQHPGHWLTNQQTLDQVVAMLYARTGLTLEEPYSSHLMVRELPELTDHSNDEGLQAASADVADPAMITHENTAATLEGESTLAPPAQQVLA